VAGRKSRIWALIETEVMQLAKSTSATETPRLTAKEYNVSPG
jgi:hypothetical protein